MIPNYADMNTTTKSLEAYKKAIREQYKTEKEGQYSSFLLTPSRAKLRQLCEERLKESDKKEDIISFKLFFGFEYDAANRNRLKAQTDKFRPIETFLKGETDLIDIEAINIAALLVNYKQRPFKAFIANEKGIATTEEVIVVDTNTSYKPEAEVMPPILTEVKNNWKKKVGMGLFAIAGVFSVGYTAKDALLDNKECIQWQTDHYEYVDCNSNTSQGFLEIPIEPAEEQKARLKKIEVNENTTFFVNDKPVVWYSKVNGVPEYFNSHGFHPITGKPLKPITKYMINKWVKKSN